MWRALLTAACFAAAAVVLVLRAPGGRGGPPGTLYPWWTWVVVAAGVAVALAPVLAPARRHVVSAAPAAALVLGLHVAGTGIVAWKHWRPVSGMTGVGTGYLPELKAAALGMAVAGLAAAVLSALPLLRQGGGGGGRLRCALVGVAVLVLVPVGLGASHADLRDLTSLGAVGLVYAGPWATGLFAAAVLHRDAAQGALLAVTLTAGLATIGPQMLALLPRSDASAVFAPVLAVALVLLALARRS